MFSFWCKKQLIVAAASNGSVLGIPPKLPQNAYSLIRLFSTAKSESEQQSVTTLSYLINNCGLSPKAGNVASKKVSLKSPEKSDLVLALLRKHGFSDAQITKMVTKVPTTLLRRPEKTILPKLAFYHSIGMPPPVLAELLSLWPEILGCSPEKLVIPFYECLKDLLQEDDKVFIAFKRSATRFAQCALRNIPYNIAVLRDYGVSKSNIAFLVVHYPHTLMMRSDYLVDLVNRVID